MERNDLGDEGEVWRGQQYEYLVMNLKGLDQSDRKGWLNKAGLEGWDLVGVDLDWVYLKRPIALVLDEEGFWQRRREGEGDG